MPRRASWLGGGGLDRTDGVARTDVDRTDGVDVDSAGCCHSFVRASSDEGLEHLSAEEKACLLFLEETIESLDNQEDSTLSNDESEYLSNPRKVANVLNGLLASASKLKHSQKRAAKQEENADVQSLQTCVVPAAVAAASKPPCSSSSPKPGGTSDKVLHSQPPSAASSKPSDHKHQKPAPPPVQPEGSVLNAPATKARDGLLKTAEGPPPRGPLSYDALVHLRKSTSTKKTPLCPTVDHTIDSGKEPCVPVEGPILGADRPHFQVSAAKCPPPVAPKPKINLAKPSEKSENEASIPSDSFYRLEQVTNPEVVRLEALQKLGLLKEAEADGDTLGPLPPPKSHSFLRPKPSKSATGPSRSPSFTPCSASENRPVPSSAAFQHLSRCEPRPVPVPAGWLERSTSKPRPGNAGPHPGAQPFTDPGSAKAPPGPQNTVGYTVVVVPGMGADRREALRKLGLLKN